MDARLKTLRRTLQYTFSMTHSAVLAPWWSVDVEGMRRWGWYWLEMMENNSVIERDIWEAVDAACFAVLDLFRKNASNEFATS